MQLCLIALEKEEQDVFRGNMSSVYLNKKKKKMIMMKGKKEREKGNDKYSTLNYSTVHSAAQEYNSANYYVKCLLNKCIALGYRYCLASKFDILLANIR